MGRLARRLRAIPGPLVGILAASGLAVLWTDVPRVDLPGDLLDAIAVPTVPALPAWQWAGLGIGALTVALVASVESLLSAVAVDRMHSGTRTDPDRELLGQGAANCVAGLLGGLPITGVIVRSSANVKAGARSRMSTVLHGLWIAVFAIALVGVIERIPLAALAGLLVLVGLQLVKVADIKAAHRHGDLPLYLVTAAGVLLLNLLEGVALGLAVAGLTVLLRAVRTHIRVDEPEAAGGRFRIVVDGALSFVGIPALSKALCRVPPGADVQIDLVVDCLDHAAFDHLDAWARSHRLTGSEVIVSEPGRPAAVERVRMRSATWSEWQVAHLSGHPGRHAMARPSAAMLAGLAAYHSETAGDIHPVMRELAHGQTPAGLILTCADSRVVPNMITHSGPGDLFTVQNVGNMVSGTATHAAVQYATTVLRVPLVAVCGHTGCGAMRALLDRSDPDRALGGLHGPLRRWLDAGTPSLTAYLAGHPVGHSALAAGRDETDALAMVNVAVQLDELRSSGVTAELMGMFFDIPTAQVLVLDEDSLEFLDAGRLGTST